MRKIKRYLAFILVVVLVLNIPIYGDATKKSVKATTTANITEDFEVTSLSELKGGFWGNPTKEIVNDAHGGNTALKLSKREADWNVYAYSISAYVGKTISIEAYMKVNASELIGAVVVKSTQGETTNYDWAASANLTSGAWTKLSGVYTVPIGATDLYFVTHKTAGTTDDYLLDDIKITVIPSIKEDFEKDSDTSTILGSTMGNPNLAIESGSPISGSKSLSVTNREANYYGYSYDLAAFAGNTIQLSAKVNTFETTAVNDVKATLAVTLSKDEYLTVASASVSGSAITVLETSAFDVPSGGKNYKLYFETAEKVSYMIDDVSITVVGTYKDPNEKTDGAIAPSIVENFNDYTDVSSKKGGSMGSPQFSLMTTDSPTGSNALLVTGRTSGYFGYSYNLSKFAGNTISISAKMCAFEATEADKNTMNITLAASKDGEANYMQVATQTVSGSAITILENKNFQVPAECDNYTLYFETTQDVSYVLDDVSITVVGTYVDPTIDDGTKYVDYSQYKVLKDLYSNYFSMGVACEAISHWNNQLSEIGNQYKEGLIKHEFNSITFGNELKPNGNMGYKSSYATETNLPFVINASAKEMLDWAKANGIKVRGHVLVWHAQTPDAVFCKGYSPVYTDANNTTLDSSCLVDRDTMLQRLESYIYSTMKYMYANGYGDVIYAWDVVNEAIDENASNKYKLRDSYWYKTIGPDFMYYAFKYAREAVNTYSKTFASSYNVDVTNSDALAAIQPKLFYNDYNEFFVAKCDAIINALSTDITGKNIVNDGFIDGIGMQSHVSDTNDVDQFITAMKRYDAVVDEVQITELDVKQTKSGANAEYYQGMFYYELFTELINAVKDGTNLTNVTFWGLTDDNSWIKDGLPLLFNGDLSKKIAFDGVVNAITGEEMPEPAYVAPDFTNMYATFESDVEGFTSRGSSTLAIQGDEVLSGSSSLKVTGRTSNWHGASFDVSRFIGQKIAVSAWVKSSDTTVKLSADINEKWPNIAIADTSSGEWVQIYGSYQIPCDLTSLNLYFETNDLADIYIDDVKVRLLGMEEGFEGTSNIAKARGAGHIPSVSVTDTESRAQGGHSYKVTRTEQDATMKFDVSKYIGHSINVSAYVKTTDSIIKMGLDLNVPLEIAIVNTVQGEWTKVSSSVKIPRELSSAAIYIETNGNADMYIDDIFVEIGTYEDTVEDTTLKFTTRWSGAGTLTREDDGTGNHVAKLTNRTGSYYGISFDVTPFLGMEVEVSVDVKTDDSKIMVAGDIQDQWPNYVTTDSVPGDYKTVKFTATLPVDIDSLKLYIETDGTSDLYADNLTVRCKPLSKEFIVNFNMSGYGEAIRAQIIPQSGLVVKPSTPTAEGYVFSGWYKEDTYINTWDFANDVVTSKTTLYAKWTVVDVTETPTITPTVTPTAAPTPSVSEDDIIKAIHDSITNDSSDEIIIDLSKDGNLSSKIIDVLRNTSATIVLNLGNGISCTIRGDQITSGVNQNINLTVTGNTSHIPDTVLNEMIKNIVKEESGNRGSNLAYQQISLIHDGDFGFIANYTFDLSETIKDLKGKLFAFIYYYNIKTKQMELQSISNVSSDGNARFPFTHASDYAIVVSDQLYIQDLDKTTFTGGQTDTLYYGGTTHNQRQLELIYPDAIQRSIDARAIDVKVKYSSSDRRVVSVNRIGRITARGVGSATIRATVVIAGNTVVVEKMITVKEAYVEIIKPNNTIAVNDKVTIQCNVYGYDVEDIIWTTMKTNKAVVGKNYGKTTAVVKGKTVGKDTLVVKVKDTKGNYVITKSTIEVVK